MRCLVKTFVIGVAGACVISTGARACIICPGEHDCNDNCIPDVCDISCNEYANWSEPPGCVNDWCHRDVCSSSSDCNDNGIPDECETPDCDNDGVPDECESVWYVDYQAFGGCGRSWDEAFYSLQDALDVASAGEEIWVAKGTYLPSEKNDNCGTETRCKTFTMLDGVDLYGGFAGDETSVGERTLFCACGDYEGRPCDDDDDCPNSTCDNSINATILSGDLDDDDEPDFENNEENSYHVVTYDDPGAAVILDGFTVKAGNADDTGSGHKNQGAGVHIRDTDPCIAGAPTLRNCIFRENDALKHGAVNDHASATMIDNCVFRDNRTAQQGAALNIDNGSATVTNCLFKDNQVIGIGGAIWSGHRDDPGVCPDPSRPTFTDCTFSGNVSGQGGAVWSTDNIPTFTRCVFTENDAGTFGGAVFAEFVGVTDDPMRFEECDFMNNTAFNLGDGGAIWLKGSVVDVVRCTFDGNENSTFSYGAALYAQSGTTRVIDSQVTNNGAFSDADNLQGGGLFFQDGAKEVIGCTVADNRGGNGGGIWTRGSTALVVTNTILWSNTNAEIFVVAGSTSPVVTYSCVDGGYEGTGNIADDPEFTSGDCGNYHLDENDSNCVDAGTQDAAQGSIDNCLDTRDKYCAVDMGAYEAQVDPGSTCCEDSDDCSGNDCCNSSCCEEEEHCCTNVCRDATTWCCDDGDCSSPTPACEVETGTCVECLDDGDCSSPTPACKVATNTCVECVDNGDCGRDPCCISNECQSCGGGGS